MPSATGRGQITSGTGDGVGPGTVADPVVAAAERWPRNGFRFDDGAGTVTALPFPELRDSTTTAAAGLAALGLARGDRVGLMLVDPEEFVVVFLAAVRLGVVPVPLYPPRSLGQFDAHLRQTAVIAGAAGARALVVTPRLRPLLRRLTADVPGLRQVVGSDDVRAGGGPRADPVAWPELRADDVAFLQFTSGSTGRPTGVPVTHRCLAANSGAILAGIGGGPGTTVGVSWLPLYHDMGLIGFVLTPLLQGLDVVLLPTMAFLRRPRCWLDAVHRYRATITFAPAFAYALATRRASEEDLAAWDLSSLEVAGCGAEPIPPDVLRRFTELFSARCGLSETAVLPAYGLAEATLAVTMKPLGTKLRTSPWQDAEVTSCGVPLPGVGLVVRDPAGRPLPEGEEGEICVRGPSVIPAAGGTRAAGMGGELATGDLGVVLDGELHVTGRIKDLLILAGRNVHPQQLEWVAGEVPGVRRGAVVAFSVPSAGGERAVVVVETVAADGSAIPGAVRERVRDELGVVVSEVTCVPRGTIPKTSSGKLRRAETRARWLGGSLAPERSGRTATSLAVGRALVRGFAARLRPPRA
jgi:fatty-acyl-CoA synthase